MAEKRKVGRPFGARHFTKAEQDIIRLGLKNGSRVDDIAALLGRGRSAVYKQIARMQPQEVVDLGQVEGCANERAGV